MFKSSHLAHEPSDFVLTVLSPDKGQQSTSAAS